MDTPKRDFEKEYAKAQLKSHLIRVMALCGGGNAAADVVVDAIGAYYGVLTDMAHNVLVWEFGQQMLSIAPEGPFRANNGYEEAIKEGQQP